MPKRKPRNPDTAPLLEELRSIEACSMEEFVSDAPSLCLLRVVPGLDTPAWTSLCADNGLTQWCAVPLSSPLPKAEVLARAIGQVAADNAAPDLQAFLRTEIERSRACHVPLALALIQPDPLLSGAGLPAAPQLNGLLALALGLKRSFDHAALLGGERLALVFSGASLAEAERMVGAILRRIRTQPAENGSSSGLFCSAGLVGYGGCVELTPDDLLTHARKALDSARGMGGNRLEVATPVDVDMASRDTLVHACEKRFLFSGRRSGDK